jgi:hypothetical protein
MYAQAAARGATAASTVAAVAGGAAGDENDVEVRKEDQDMINEFGTLNSRFHEVDEDLRGLKVRVVSRVMRVVPCHVVEMGDGWEEATTCLLLFFPLSLLDLIRSHARVVGSKLGAVAFGMTNQGLAAFGVCAFGLTIKRPLNNINNQPHTGAAGEARRRGDRADGGLGRECAVRPDLLTP